MDNSPKVTPYKAWRTPVVVLKGKERGNVGFIIGDLAARSLAPSTRILVHFRGRSYPRDLRGILAANLREPTAAELLFVETDIANGVGG